MENPSLLEVVFDHNPDGLLIVDSSGKVVKFNKKFEELLGRPHSDIEVMTLEKVMSIFDSKDDDKIIDKSSSQLNGMPYVLWIFRDITLVKKNEEILTAITSMSPDIISVLDATGKLIFNSQASHRIHGYTEEDMIGKNTFEFIHPDDQENVQKAMEQLFTVIGKSISVQYRYRNKDNSYVWMEATGHNEINNPHIKGIIAISRDISKRKQLENELRSAIAARDEFVSVASHEFKTPLIAMRLLVQIMERELQKFGAFKEGRLDNLLDQVSNLIYLVDDLFNVNLMRSGQLIYHFNHTNVSEILDKVLQRSAAAIHESRCTLKLDVEKELYGEVDGPRLERVFSNLINNAIKYAPETEIQISLYKEKDHFCFSIVDRGPGIPPEKHQIIFEAFERAADKKRFTGLGLGLYICRQIVHAHKGSIAVFSNPVQKGSEFKVMIPLIRS